MIPRRLTVDITIYPRWQNLLTGQIKPMRRVLRRCTWQMETVSTALSTGQILTTPTVVTVFKKTSGLEYIKPHEWALLSENELAPYWTVDLTGTARPIIVPWVSDYEFNFGTSAAVTTAENNFVRDNPGAIRAQHTDNNQFSGGERGGHILIMGN